jgi:hypothetical protein
MSIKALILKKVTIITHLFFKIYNKFPAKIRDLYLIYTIL